MSSSGESKTERDGESTEKQTRHSLPIHQTQTEFDTSRDVLTSEDAFTRAGRGNPAAWAQATMDMLVKLGLYWGKFRQWDKRGNMNFFELYKEIQAIRREIPLDPIHRAYCRVAAMILTIPGALDKVPDDLLGELSRAIEIAKESRGKGMKKVA